MIFCIDFFFSWPWFLTYSSCLSKLLTSFVGRALRLNQHNFWVIFCCLHEAISLVPFWVWVQKTRDWYVFGFSLQLSALGLNKCKEQKSVCMITAASCSWYFFAWAAHHYNGLISFKYIKYSVFFYFCSLLKNIFLPDGVLIWLTISWFEKIFALQVY